jgi:hypothetical protein
MSRVFGDSGPGKSHAGKWKIASTKQLLKPGAWCLRFSISQRQAPSTKQLLKPGSDIGNNQHLPKQREDTTTARSRIVQDLVRGEKEQGK